MQARNLLIPLFLLATICSNSQTRYNFENQSEDYPIYSSIDTSELTQFKNLFGFGNIDLERFEDMRTYLKPYLEKNDPLALLLCAYSYDLGPYGINNDSTDSLAMFYYNKLVEMNCVKAETLLHSAYKYGSIGLDIDYIKSLEMLNRAILHGDSETKAWGYFEYAHLYDGGNENFEIEQDLDKTMEYLAKTIQYDSTHHMAIDFLADLYHDKALEFEKEDSEQAQEFGRKSFDLKMISTNDQSKLEAALWLIEGKYVEKDIERGVAIITREARIIQRDYPNVYEYMGSYNPVLMLNDLYKENIVTWEQVKDFYLENYY